MPTCAMVVSVIPQLVFYLTDYLATHFTIFLLILKARHVIMCKKNPHYTATNVVQCQCSVSALPTIYSIQQSLQHKFLSQMIATHTGQLPFYEILGLEM